jgi:hypothetical protein
MGLARSVEQSSSVSEAVFLQAVVSFCCTRFSHTARFQAAATAKARLRWMQSSFFGSATSLLTKLSISVNVGVWPSTGPVVLL